MADCCSYIHETKDDLMGRVSFKLDILGESCLSYTSNHYRIRYNFNDLIDI